ncbi:CAP domain-containing protein [Deinococcus sp. Marseille-Q6407]|uniref:CAP domain-containing protein n=1 Tax=Deinococcus sp. Marseille-Q6407 TaxID=2969223 RepID=UPI0021C1B896|nr:CAP domain-containing protein [Deinococcus sp. Marseille-Q6407]
MQGATYENNRSHPNFYGYDLADRLYRAYAELGLGTPGMVSGGEIVNAGRSTAAESIKSFLRSLPHCQILAQNNIASVGVGYTSAPYESATPTKPTVYEHSWTVNFGR